MFCASSSPPPHQFSNFARANRNRPSYLPNPQTFAWGWQLIFRQHTAESGAFSANYMSRYICGDRMRLPAGRTSLFIGSGGLKVLCLSISSMRPPFRPQIGPGTIVYHGALTNVRFKGRFGSITFASTHFVLVVSKLCTNCKSKLIIPTLLISFS